MEDILGIKEEKEMTVKEQREINLIVENLELIKVIMKVFQGQVLYMDLQEFCLRFKVFDTGEAFGYAVEKLIKGKVLKKTIYPNTNYIVLIAKTCVNRYMNNVDDSIDFSSSTVRLNCFKNAVMVKEFNRPDCTIDMFISSINHFSTFLHSKNDTESAYNFFNQYLELNEIAEKSLKCARYRNSKGLKYVETVGTKEDELLDFKNSFDTFVNRNIYAFYHHNKFTFYILDVSDNLNAEKVGKKIGAVIGTFYEQVEQLSLNKLDTVEFVVIARDKVRRDKVVGAFRKSYNKEHIITSAEAKNDSELGKKTLIKAYREYLLDAINMAIKKRFISTPKVKYVDRNKESKDIFMFRNVFETQYGLNINIKVLDANLNDRLNMYTRVANLQIASQSKHEKALEKKLRAKIEADIYRKAEAIHSATEEEIRKAIKAEYGIYDDFDFDNEE